MLNHGRYKPDYYPLGHIVLILAGICLLVAGWIAATTAVDLWKIRTRGRSLALTTAVILGLLSLQPMFSNTTRGYGFWMAVSIFTISVGTIFYLRLPTIRSQFESQTSTQRNS